MDRCAYCRNHVVGDDPRVPWVEREEFCLEGHDVDRPPRLCKDVQVGKPLTVREFDDYRALEVAGL